MKYHHFLLHAFHYPISPGSRHARDQRCELIDMRELVRAVIGEQIYKKLIVKMVPASKGRKTELGCSILVALRA
jgi:hypothetical protein